MNINRRDKVRIETTLDGSVTLYLPDIDEHYHSVNGAMQESMHVYINAGLKECKKKCINILEVGFGTGLNAYLSLLYSKENGKKIDYTAIELFPLAEEIIHKLNYASPETFSGELFERLHTSCWNVKEQITHWFDLSKFGYDFTDLNFSFDNTFDVIYFDAFAPDKQPAMWTQDIFDFLHGITAENGILTTYCAKGSVRRMLMSSGYSVQRLPGPPGKREILQAQRK